METIRKAQPEDSAAIALVHVESWRTTYKDIVPIKDHRTYDDRLNLWQRILSVSAGGDITLVAVSEQGQIVGFVNGGKTRDSELEYEAELNAIYLLEEVQGHGLGHRLVQALVEQLIQMGYQSMVLWALARNLNACRFYESLGGTYVKTISLPIGEASYDDVAYGWHDIRLLL